MHCINCGTTYKDSYALSIFDNGCICKFCREEESNPRINNSKLREKFGVRAAPKRFDIKTKN